MAGLTNQIAEGSFLLFLANLIGITVTSLVVFLVQRYGSIRRCWRNLLVWLGLLGLLSIPLSSALHDFSVRQEMDHFESLSNGVSTELISSCDNVQSIVAFSLSFASSDGSVGLN